MTDDLPTPAQIIAAHDRIEELYDLKYTGTMTAAPKRTLRREVLEPAAEHDDPYRRAERRYSGRSRAPTSSRTRISGPHGP